VDIFIEQIVERRPDAQVYFFRALLLVVAVALIALLFTVAIMFLGLVFISFTAIAAIPGVAWLSNHFLKELTVEYEYILTNKELDIDKITGRRKRRRMFTLDLSNAEKLDLYADDTVVEAGVTISAHDNSYVNMWYLVVKHDSHGKVVLMFNPNKVFVDKLNGMLPKRAQCLYK